MIYRFTLTYNTVDLTVVQPRGWNEFESEIKRDFNSHGVVFKFTSGTLKLGFADGRSFLETAFQADGNEAIVYFTAESRSDQYQSWDVDFYGTAIMKNRDYSNEYFEVDFEGSGIQQLVTNRINTKVNLGTSLDLDGNALSSSLTSYTNTWNTISLYNDYVGYLVSGNPSPTEIVATETGISANDSTETKTLNAYFGFGNTIFNNFENITKESIDLVVTTEDHTSENILPLAKLVYAGSIYITAGVFFKVYYSLSYSGSPVEIEFNTTVLLTKYTPSTGFTSNSAEYVDNFLDTSPSSPQTYTLEAPFSLPISALVDDTYPSSLIDDELYISIQMEAVSTGSTGSELTCIVNLYNTAYFPI